MPPETETAPKLIFIPYPIKKPPTVSELTKLIKSTLINK